MGDNKEKKDKIPPPQKPYKAREPVKGENDLFEKLKEKKKTNNG